jgi:hypothetical protein
MLFILLLLSKKAISMNTDCDDVTPTIRCFLFQLDQQSIYRRIIRVRQALYEEVNRLKLEQATHRGGPNPNVVSTSGLSVGGNNHEWSSDV